MDEADGIRDEQEVEIQVRTEVAKGSDPDAKTLAQDITSLATDIDDLRALLP
jgi:hypothetical protein